LAGRSISYLQSTVQVIPDPASREKLCQRLTDPRAGYATPSPVMSGRYGDGGAANVKICCGKRKRIQG
jgi:hypothetical protein